MNARTIVALLVLLGSTAAWPAGESSEAAAPQKTETDEPEAPGTEAETASEAKPSLDERLDAILAETLSKDEYRESRRCLSRFDYRSVEILSRDYLLFSRGGDYWLNKLRNRCISLRRDMVLTFNPRGSSNSCEGDLVYVTDRYDLDRGFSPTGIPYSSQGSCVLGAFERISGEQAALLREAR
ncbi:MAG: hypothetical protein P8Y69_03550 [Gammaproteobacteria bacterium]|jgi:hypothetical protein